MRSRRKPSAQQFVDYVLSFYGRGGIYAFRPVMRHSEARYALGILLKAAAAGDLEEIGVPRGSSEIEGDSVDRELARDIVLLVRDPTAQDQVGPRAYRLFRKYAHKRWQSRRPQLKVVRSTR